MFIFINKINLGNYMILLEELKGSHMIIYHRTKNKYLKDILLKGEFKGGGNIGAMYGEGLYTTYEDMPEDSQNADWYGHITLQFKVSLDNFLVLDYDVFEKLSSYKKILEQFIYKKTNMHTKLDKTNFVDAQLIYYEFEKIDEYSQYLKDKQYSSQLFQEILADNPYMVKVVDGVVYSGESDGKCCVVYNVRSAIPIKIRSPLSDYQWISVLNKKELLKYLKDIYQRGIKTAPPGKLKYASGKLEVLNYDPIIKQNIYTKNVEGVPITKSQLYKCEINRIEPSPLDDNIKIKNSKMYLCVINRSTIYNSLLHKCHSRDLDIDKSIINDGAIFNSNTQNSRVMSLLSERSGYHNTNISDSKLFYGDYLENCTTLNTKLDGGESKHGKHYGATIIDMQMHNDIIKNSMVKTGELRYCKIYNSNLNTSVIKNGYISKCELISCDIIRSELISCTITKMINNLGHTIDESYLFDCIIDMEGFNKDDLIGMLDSADIKYTIKKDNKLLIHGRISSELIKF